MERACTVGARWDRIANHSASAARMMRPFCSNLGTDSTRYRRLRQSGAQCLGKNRPASMGWSDRQCDRLFFFFFASAFSHVGGLDDPPTKCVALDSKDHRQPRGDKCSTSKLRPGSLDCAMPTERSGPPGGTRVHASSVHCKAACKPAPHRAPHGSVPLVELGRPLRGRPTLARHTPAASEGRAHRSRLLHIHAEEPDLGAKHIQQVAHREDARSLCACRGA